MPNKLVTLFFQIVIAIVAWTYWLPLLVAIWTDTLTSDGIEKKTRSICTTCNTTLDERDIFRNAIRNLEAKIATADPNEFKQLLEVYRTLSDRSKAITARIHLAQYANSQTCHYFFASYLALATLYAMLLPNKRQRPIQTYPISLSWYYGAGFYLFFNWSNWLRNTQWGQHDRTLYSYAHLDISPAGFAMQELNLLGMMILCGHIIALSFESTQTSVSSPAAPAELSIKTRHEFERWQLKSALLAAAFLPWTAFYWHVVTSFGELRYYASAISIHLIWLSIWITISVPCWRLYQEWQDFIVCSSAIKDVEELKKLQLIEPISRSTLFISATTSTFSFLYPFLQPLFPK